ncbi:MAG: tRNA (guanine-N7)-methyltransferase [Nocardioides sp.]
MSLSDPARPHAAHTEAGRPLREVTSYTRRGSRLSPKQQRAWSEYADRWVVPTEVATTRPVAEWFDRNTDLSAHLRAHLRAQLRAELIVEIGSGIGEVATAVALARPECHVLAFEVWKPGVAAGLDRAGTAGVDNLRFCLLDAVWAFREAVPADGIAELLTFFPDPWHKKRHHKRRLITPAFARLAAERVRPGGTWRIATDWPAYADHIGEVFDEVAPLWAGGQTDRWEGRPLTKFERRGLAEGRPIADFTFTRR